MRLPGAIPQLHSFQFKFLLKTLSVTMSFNGSYGNGQWLEGFQVTPEAQAQAQAQIRPSSWPEEGQTVHAQAVIDLTQDETEAENVIDPVLGAMSQVQAVAGHENGE